MAPLKGGSNMKSWTGLGDVSVMASWVIPFFSPFWFKTNQTSITQKKTALYGIPNKSIHLKMGGLNVRGAYGARQMAAVAAVVQQDFSSRGGGGWRWYIRGLPDSACQWSLWAEIAVTERRERKRRKAQRTEGMCSLLSAPGFWQEDHPWTSGTPPPLPLDPLPGCGHIQIPRY